MDAATPRRYSLDVIPIASPCTEDWNRMHGSDAVKFCDKCQLHVHNLSAMPEAEAKQLLEERAGRLCVRYEVEPTLAPRGTARPSRATIELRRKQGRPAAWWGRAAAAIGLGFIGAFSLAGCDQDVQAEGECEAPVTLDLHREQPPPLVQPPVVGLVAPPKPVPAPRTIMGDAVDPPPKIMGKPAPPTTQPAKQAMTCEPGESLHLTKLPPTPRAALMGSPPPNVVLGEIEAPPQPAPKPAPPATQPATSEPQSGATDSAGDTFVIPAASPRPGASKSTSYFVAGGIGPPPQTWLTRFTNWLLSW